MRGAAEDTRRARVDSTVLGRVSSECARSECPAASRAAMMSRWLIQWLLQVPGRFPRLRIWGWLQHNKPGL